MAPIRPVISGNPNYSRGSGRYAGQPAIAGGPPPGRGFQTASLGGSFPGTTGGSAVDIARQFLGQGKGSGALDSLMGVNSSGLPYCAYFVSAALQKAGLSVGGKQGSVQGILDWGKSNGRFTPKGGRPQPGDVVIFKNGRSHTGLVSQVFPDGSFSTVEGNGAGGKVVERRYSANEGSLTGFVRPAGGNTMRA